MNQNKIPAAPTLGSPPTLPKKRHLDCNTVFIDESGAGANKRSKDNFWVSAGVCAKFEDHDEITESLFEMKKKCLRLYNQELKGGATSKSNLNPDITKEDVAKELGNIISKHGLKVWVISTRYSDRIQNSNFIPSNGKVVMAKDVSRGLLLERLSGYVEYYGGSDQRYQLVWDLSDQQEMSHFSHTISEYVNPHNNKKVCPEIIPYLLAGLSHEWAELQIADVISNFALNYSAHPRYDDVDVDVEKAIAFEKHIHPKLCCNANGRIDGVGWKMYDY